MSKQVIFASVATAITWAFTALGAGTVVLFNNVCDKFYNIMLGFASGIMLAASFWSLIQPALEITQGNTFAVISVALFFVFGSLFMVMSEKTIEFMSKRFKSGYLKRFAKQKELFMLVYSITIHNIPEGLAVGVAFGAIKKMNCMDEIISAVIIAIGIAIQNFPEGAAISIPLRGYGYSKIKSFVIGQASALVEPIFGIIGALLVVYVKVILPYCLSFAAGCMIFVVVSELIPSCKDNKNFFAVFTVIGFCIMMLLDVLL